MSPSKWEVLFETLWIARGGEQLSHEVRFHPKRRWRFDFALPERMIAFEIEGGHWAGGRHTRGSGFAKDCEKYLEAALAGWTVVRLTAEQINTETIDRLIEWIDPLPEGGAA